MFWCMWCPLYAGFLFSFKGIIPDSSGVLGSDEHTQSTGTNHAFLSSSRKVHHFEEKDPL